MGSIEAELSVKCPTVFRRDGYQRLDNRDWESLVAWDKFLMDEAVAGRITGLALPLELGTQSHALQELYGYDLLEYFRWQEKFRSLPVLAFAWQPLEEVLRRRASPLLLHEHTCFKQLPLDDLNFKPFNSTVSREFPRHGLGWEEVAGHVDPGLRSVTYHDLANDFYSAHRLWCGYKWLLNWASSISKADGKEALERRKSARDAESRWAWLTTQELRVRGPIFKRFQFLSADREFPGFANVEGSADDIKTKRTQLLTHHLLKGLSPDTRILFVDDCFTKGSADVLLEMFFPGASFGHRIDDHEWVYSQNDSGNGSSRRPQPWARLVCVDSAYRAESWLMRWRILDQDKDVSRLDWRDAWLGTSSPPGPEIVGDELRDAPFSFDLARSVGKRSSTLLLLDLRLDKKGLEPLYTIDELASIQLRRTVRDKARELPIVMFTASRQALNYRTIMTDALDVDGWLLKEAPDTLSNDENSSATALSLLEKVHLLPALSDWYRPEMEWTLDKKLQFARWRQQPDHESIRKKIEDIVFAALNSCISNEPSNPKLGLQLAYVNGLIPAAWGEVARVYFSRLFLAGAAILTAHLNAESDLLSVDGDRLAAFLPYKVKNSEKTKLTEEYTLSRMQDFGKSVWMKGTSFLSQLMDIEIDWLRGFPWPKNKEAILRALGTRHDF